MPLNILYGFFSAILLHITALNIFEETCKQHRLLGSHLLFWCWFKNVWSNLCSM